MARPPEYGSISFLEDERRAATAPPYAELQIPVTLNGFGVSNESLDLLAPLLPPRQTTQNVDEQRVLDGHLSTVLVGGVLAVFSGIISCSCNLFINFVPLEFTDLSLVRSGVQFLFGLVVLICTGQRPQWSETSSRMHKVFAVLFCPFYGIMIICQLSLYPFSHLNSLQFVIATSVVFTCFWSSVLMKDRFRLWKMLVLVIYIIGMAAFLKPSIIWQFVGKNSVTKSCIDGVPDETKLGVALIGVALLSSFLNTSFDYANTVSIGLFIAYSAIGSAVVTSTAAYFDANQMILSSNINQIPFINWIFMVGYGIVSALSLGIFLKSIRMLGVVLATFLFFFSTSVIQQTIINLIDKQPVDAYSLLGGCLLALSTIGIMAENSIRTKLHRIPRSIF